MSDSDFQVAYRRLWSSNQNWSSPDINLWLAKRVAPPQEDSAVLDTILSTEKNEVDQPQLKPAEVELEASQLMTQIPTQSYDPLKVWGICASQAIQLMTQMPILVVESDTGYRPVGDLALAYSLLSRMPASQKIWAKIVDDETKVISSLSVLLQQPACMHLRAKLILDTKENLEIDTNNDKIIADYEGITTSAVRHRRGLLRKNNANI